MVDTKSKPATLPGGGFVMAPVPVEGVFSREQFDEETLEIVGEFERFFVNEVLPRTEELEHKATIEVDGETVPLAVHLLKQAGELGALSAEIPDEYDGLGLDVRTGSLMSEATGGNSGFAVTVGAHLGIGTQPIVYFGNEEQKKKWLPVLGTAELVSCYALTEPGAGSDALSGRTTAELSDDGTHYVVNGEKCFISNGNWADVAIVFARIDGLYSALIVDLHSEGVSRGAEEKKMGQLGSSTTALIFEDVKVPVENRLGEPGDASKIALNILNLGRLKLGFGCLGSMKYAINRAVKYSLERKQFGQAIGKFDMQKARLAGMVAKTYATDATCYRIAGAIDEEMESGADAVDAADKAAKKVAAVRKYALESSIAKIYGSEGLHHVAQNAVFMHGGYGYLTEYQVERVYRDNIVDMIYEGTNDVNRMVIFDDFVRNLFGAQIPFRESVEALDNRMREGNYAPEAVDGVPECVADLATKIMAAKQALLYTINHAIIHTGKNVRNEQQVMREVSDALVHTYVMESTLARVINLINARGESKSSVDQAIARIIAHEGLRAVAGHTTEALLCAIEPGAECERKIDELEKLQGAMRTRDPVGLLRRQVADAVISAGRYPF